jgi:predicted nucleic acid-binding protein
MSTIETDHVYFRDQEHVLWLATRQRYAAILASSFVRGLIRRVTDSWIGYLAILHRDIEVHTDEDPFVLEIEVGDSELVG